MKLDVLIENGTVVDPSQGWHSIKSLGIKNGKFVTIPLNYNVEAEHYINATGCFVSPGFIDYHTHIFGAGSNLSINPDMLFATGVTAAVDAGSSGSSNFEAFHKSVIQHTNIKIKAYINAYSGGQLDFILPEIYDSSLFNPEKLETLFNFYSDTILGIKVRIEEFIVGNRSKEVLLDTIKLAESIGENVPVYVHTTNPTCDIEDIVKILRKGDVYGHCFNGKGQHILDDNDKIRACIIEAREKGIIFDAANGRNNYSNYVGENAIKQGFIPDIISSDVTREKYNYGNYARSLPFVMSKYLSMGLSLDDVIERVTVNPANMMKMNGQIGTLKSGAFGDVVIYKVIEGKVIHRDWASEPYLGHHLLIPQMTICNGEIVYCQEDFNLELVN